MTNFDIRWHQRLENFDTALKQLSEAVALSNERALSALEEQGLIQAFEYNFELSWNLIKDFYQAQGETDIQGSRDAYRLAFSRGLVTKGDVWMNMIKSRMLTSHTYNRATAEQVLANIITDYHPEFEKLSLELNQQKQKNVK